MTTENPQHFSKSVEHGTPAEVIAAAKKVLGKIDWDPATSKVFNTRVGARRICTEAEPGFHRKWRGRVFLNPPGGYVRPDGTCATAEEARARAPGLRSSICAWWTNLLFQYEFGLVTSAVFVGFSLEALQRGQTACVLPSTPYQKQWQPQPGELDPLHNFFNYCLCVPSHRLAFVKFDPDHFMFESQKSPTHANFIAYLPPRADPFAAREFKNAFSSIGMVYTP